MFNLAHYLKFLLIFILLRTDVFASVQGFSSGTWKRLLSFENKKFNAQYDWFYLSSSKNRSLETEWLSAIDAIVNKKLVGREKKLFQCAFPARFAFIKKFNPDLQDENCPEFQEWINEIAVKEIYIVYAASYVTNPASMFGHTFLRLSKGRNDRVSALTDYSVGFLAATDPTDDKVSYTIKGLTGGYIGHFDIKPFYMNVGLYQNAEDRDLWQYKLNISKAQIDFFMKHLWELSFNTGFKYYFFDENCSSTLLKLIQVTDENIDFFKNKNYIFAHPIETLKWAKNDLIHESNNYYASTNKILRSKIEMMSNFEKDRYIKYKKFELPIENETSILVLDALIDYWKFENYKVNTNLNTQQKDRFNKILIARSKIKQASKDIHIIPKPEESPILFHDPNSFSLSQGYNFKARSDFQDLNFKLGYHGLLDRHWGHDKYSYIDYFELNFRNEDKFEFQKFKLVEILSLSPFLNEFKTISWNLSIDYLKDNIFVLKSALGASRIDSDSVYFSFIGVESSLHSSKLELMPYVQFGFKWTFEKGLLYIEIKNQIVDKDIYSKFEIGPVYYLTKSSDLRFLNNYSDTIKDSTESKLEWNFYF